MECRNGKEINDTHHFAGENWQSSEFSAFFKFLRFVYVLFSIKISESIETHATYHARFITVRREILQNLQKIQRFSDCI